MGLRSIDVQTNRGEGGQNEIGPELFRDIGVLRTSELLCRAPHRWRGAVFHARHRLRLFVRSAGSDRQVGPQGDRGRLRAADPHAPSRRRAHHEHPGPRRRPRARSDHDSDARSAISAAGDPSKYPEQIAEGLRPWQPKKLYFTAASADRRPGGREDRRRPPPPDPNVKL